MDDQNQLVNRLAKPGTKPDEAIPLLQSDGSPRRQLAAQDLILDLEILDLPGQLFLRGPGDQEEKFRVDIPHGRSRRKVLISMGMTSFLHTDAPSKSRYFSRAPVNLPVAVFGAAKKSSLVNSRRDFSVNWPRSVS